MTQEASLERVTVVCIPADDAPFRAYVQMQLSELGPSTLGRSLQSAIRRVYPHAVVHPPGRMQSLTGGTAVRYAYRDGSEAVERDAGWWKRPGVAHAAFGDDGIYRHGNREACELFGVDSLAGRDWSEFATPESMAEADALWSVLVTNGEVGPDTPIQSTYHVARPDGTVIEIEYRTERNHESNLFETWLRPVATASARDS